MKLPLLPNFPFLEKFKKFPAPEEFLVLEVDSATAKSLRFSLDREGGIELLGVGKHPIEDRGAVKLGKIIDEAMVTEALGYAVKRSLSTAITPIKKAIFGVYGLSSCSFSTAARTYRSEPEKLVARKEILDLVEKMQEAAYLRAGGSSAYDSGDSSIEMDLTNSAIVSVAANETLVSEEGGFSTEKFEVSLFTAFSPVKCMEMAERICRKLDLDLLSTSAEIYSMTQVLSSENSQEFNNIILGVRRDLTEVAIIFGGGVKQSLCFGIGADDLAEDGENLNLWLSALSFTLGEFEGVKTFPNEFLIYGDGAKVTELIDGLNSPTWSGKLRFSGSIVSRIIDFESLAKLRVPADLALVEDFPAISLGIVGKDIFGN